MWIILSNDQGLPFKVLKVDKKNSALDVLYIKTIPSFASDRFLEKKLLSIVFYPLQWFNDTEQNPHEKKSSKTATFKNGYFTLHMVPIHTRKK